MHYTRVRKKVCSLCKKPITDEGNHDVRRHDQCVEDKLAVHKPTPAEIEAECLLIRKIRVEERLLEDPNTFNIQAQYMPRVAKVSMGKRGLRD